MKRAHVMATAWAVAFALAAVLVACGGPDRTDPDMWRWESDEGPTFAELRDACLSYQQQQVAAHLASSFAEEVPGVVLFSDFAELAAALTSGNEDCAALRLGWPGPRDALDAVTWLDLLAATDGDPRLDPETLYALREHGPLPVAEMAELLLFDATLTMIIVERPTADTDSQAVARTLLFTWGIDLGEATRLDDSVVLLALAETVPEMSGELRQAPPEMAGWAALAGILRYLAADLHRLAWCYRDTIFGPPLEGLVEAATAEESGGSLSRAAAYYARNRAHFDARCLPGLPAPQSANDLLGPRCTPSGAPRWVRAERRP